MSDLKKLVGEYVESKEKLVEEQKDKINQLQLKADKWDKHIECDTFIKRKIGSGVYNKKIPDIALDLFTYDTDYCFMDIYGEKYLHEYTREYWKILSLTKKKEYFERAKECLKNHELSIES